MTGNVFDNSSERQEVLELDGNVVEVLPKLEENQEYGLVKLGNGQVAVAIITK